jgi:hypothetical protein
MGPAVERLERHVEALGDGLGSQIDRLNRLDASRLDHARASRWSAGARTRMWARSFTSRPAGRGRATRGRPTSPTTRGRASPWRAAPACRALRAGLTRRFEAPPRMVAVCFGPWLSQWLLHQSRPSEPLKMTRFGGTRQPRRGQAPEGCFAASGSGSAASASSPSLRPTGYRPTSIGSWTT